MAYIRIRICSTSRVAYEMLTFGISRNFWKEKDHLFFFQWVRFCFLKIRHPLYEKFTSTFHLGCYVDTQLRRAAIQLIVWWPVPLMMWTQNQIVDRQFEKAPFPFFGSHMTYIINTMTNQGRSAVLSQWCGFKIKISITGGREAFSRTSSRVLTGV